MANFKETGVKISQFPDAPVNMTGYKYKLELPHRVISWAPSHYGISTISKNYQISIDALRKDFKGYVGINYSKGEYQSYLTFWKGNWSDNDRTNSYVYEWGQNNINHKDYIHNKHGLDETYDAKNNIERVFILSTAPYPLEAEDTNVNSIDNKTFGADPNPNSVKLVDKKYVDERHNGFRKVEKAANPITEQGSSILEIRPYTCFYQYTNPPGIDPVTKLHTINITDTQVMEDGKTLKEVIRNNRVPFYLRIKNNDTFHQIDNEHKCNLQILVNGSKENLTWSYQDELIEIVRQNRNIRKENGDIINVGTGYIFIRCQAEYIDDVFTVTCSNFFGRDKKSKKITRVQFPQNVSSEETTPTGKTIENNTIKLDLSLHEHETFLTNIPQNDSNITPFPQYYIELDVSGLDDYHEYTWDYFVITPDQTLTVDDNGNFTDKNYDDVIFDGATILWANEDGYNLPPKLQPNKVYCFQFCKIFDKVLIGRIKYFINLVKKN